MVAHSESSSSNAMRSDSLPPRPPSWHRWRPVAAPADHIPQPVPARPLLKRRAARAAAARVFIPPCVMCNRRFGSWWALFAHMRSHPERHWLCSFPRPVGPQEATPPRLGVWFIEELRGREEVTIDLNDEQPQDEITTERKPIHPAENDGAGGTDLNKSPGKDDTA